MAINSGRLLPLRASRDIYQCYHEKLRNIIKENIKIFNRSIIIDIHGFEKHKRPPGYRDVELILGTNNLNSLFNHAVPRRDWDKNIRGNIIKKFLDISIPIAPGHPRRKEYVLTGGFITQKYGAAQIPKSQAIQIEFSDRIRFHDEDLKKLVLTSLAEVLIDELSE